MNYPLYKYYLNFDMNLDEIIDHYVLTFYSRKHNQQEILNVLKKVKESDKVQKLCNETARKYYAPSYEAFANCIKSTLWFLIKPSETIVLASLFAILVWDERINRIHDLKSSKELKDDAIKLFKKYKIEGELSEDIYLNETIEGKKEKLEREKAKAIKEEMNSITESWYFHDFMSKFPGATIRLLNFKKPILIIDICTRFLNFYNYKGPNKITVHISIRSLETGNYKVLDNCKYYNYIDNTIKYGFCIGRIKNTNEYLLYEIPPRRM